MKIKFIKKTSKLLALLLMISISFLGVPIEAEVMMPNNIVNNLSSQTLQETVGNESTILLEKVVNCPKNIDEIEPSRTILQIINNTYHKWNEYDLGSNGEFCIVLEEPFYKALLESEASDLLTLSKSWEKQELQRSEIMEVLSFDDPSVNLPTISKKMNKDTTETAYNLKNDSEKYISEQKSALLNEYNKKMELQGVNSINNHLEYEDLEILINGHKAITVLMDTKYPSNVEEKIEELETKQSSSEIIKSEMQLNIDDSDSLILQDDSSVSWYESEDNYPESDADYVNSYYTEIPFYNIFGEISSVAYDMDMYRFDVSTPGFLNVLGIWVGDIADKGWDEDLHIVLRNSNGENIAFSNISDDGTSDEHQEMFAEVTQGTYYFLVFASNDYEDLYVGEDYGLDIAFSQTEEIIDDPTLITNTNTYPYSTIGFVNMTFPNGSNYRASGFLISPYTILTNGHVVYGADSGGYVETLAFSPGQYQLSSTGSIIKPYGTKTAVSWETNTMYENTEDFPYDYATAHFDTAFAGITTFMPLVFDYEPESINLAGYPAYALGSSSSGMWHSLGSVIDTIQPESLLCYLAYTYGGSSGSPVWAYDAETQTKRVVAVHSFGASTYNGGPKFTSANQAIIEEWLQWLPPSVESDVSGYIELESKGLDNYDSVSVQLTNGDNSYNDVTSSDGAFIFENVENGEYTLTIEFDGYLSRLVGGITVNNENVEITDNNNAIGLWAGDLDGITGVDAGDLAYLISKLGLVDSDIEYDVIVDFDNLTGIDSGDLAVIIKNLGKTSNDYPLIYW